MTALAAVAVVAAGCVEDGKISRVGEPTSVSTTTEARARTSTTTDGSAGDDTTTTVAGSDGDTTTTTAPGGASGGNVPADETSTDENWAASPGEYRGQDGLRVAYTCPPAGATFSVWGTGPYTDDSSVCTAALYEGRITLADGGRVVVEISPGRDTYEGGEANGVTTESYGTWAGSFDIVG